MQMAPEQVARIWRRGLFGLLALAAAIFGVAGSGILEIGGKTGRDAVRNLSPSRTDLPGEGAGDVCGEHRLLTALGPREEARVLARKQGHDRDLHALKLAGGHTDLGNYAAARAQLRSIGHPTSPRIAEQAQGLLATIEELETRYGLEPGEDGAPRPPLTRAVDPRESWGDHPDS